MKRYRLTRVNDSGFAGRRFEEAVVELADKADPPPDSIPVPDDTPLHDWQPQVAAGG